MIVRLTVVQLVVFLCSSISEVLFDNQRISKCLITLFLLSPLSLRFIIGIKHGFSCINIRQVPWEVLKTEAEGRGFQHLQRDLANVNVLKNHVQSLL